MNLLLDTHLLLWVAEGDPRLPKQASELIEDAENKLFFSVVSLWEVVIKSSLGREDFAVDAVRLRTLLLRNGYAEVPILGEHVQQLASLPPVPRDPFDRMLLAQARVETCRLATIDDSLARYGEPVLKL